MSIVDHPFSPATLRVEPWPDPVIDQVGHDPRSAYVERFWLGILGPSTVWLLRRLAAGLEANPEGFDLDVGLTAQALGVGSRGGRSSPFMRSIDRSCRFGAARLHGVDTLSVRRKLPPLTRGQLQRLPEPLQAEHAEWLARTVPTESDSMRRRARALALSLLELGEDAEAVERQLHRWRFHPAMAHEALRWALGEHAGDRAPQAS